MRHKKCTTGHRANSDLAAPAAATALSYVTTGNFRRGKGKRGRGGKVTCRAKFPKTKQIAYRAKVVCPGVAAEHGLRISGRQNALGTILARRRSAWLSGTMPPSVAHMAHLHSLQLGQTRISGSLPTCVRCAACTRRE